MPRGMSGISEEPFVARYDMTAWGLSQEEHNDELLAYCLDMEPDTNRYMPRTHQQKWAVANRGRKRAPRGLICYHANVYHVPLPAPCRIR